MKRNDASHIPAPSVNQNQGKYVAFVSKNHLDTTPDNTLESTIIAASDTYAAVWQNNLVQTEFSRIAALDAATANTLQEVVVVHYINEILT